MNISHFVQIMRKKKWLLLMIAIIIAGGGFWTWKKFSAKTQTTRYITAVAEKGVLTSSISGTGQVLPTSQVEISAKASGKVVAIGVKKGQQVKEGDIIIQLDAREAALAVNQAKTNLDLAKLDLSELLAPPSTSTLIQTENSLAKAKEDLKKLKLSQEIIYQQTIETKQKAEDDLEKSYEDAYNTIANAFLDLPDAVTSLYDILFGYGISRVESEVSPYSLNNEALSNNFLLTDTDLKYKFETYLNGAKNNYNSVKASYETNFDSYKNASRYSEREVIDNLLLETVETFKETSDAIKNTFNMLDFWKAYRTSRNLEVWDKVSEFQTDLNNLTLQTNNALSSLLSVQRTIQDNKESILNTDRDLQEMDLNNPVAIAQAERSIQELEIKLEDLKVGPDSLDVENQKLVIAQRQNDIWSAQQNLSDYYIRAPFAGEVVNFEINKGDTVGAGTVCTLITKEKIAEITLNEVDVAKVELGQLAALTFDAIENFDITGEVVEIDSLGTVSQGVVSYNIKIAFDVQDDRIKPNMTVSATVILKSKPDVLLVPSSAVKAQGGDSYVEVLVNGAPEKKTVTVGESNDTMTEIVSGLNEGEEVVRQTITAGSTTSQQSSTNSSGQRGGEMRMPGMF